MDKVKFEDFTNNYDSFGEFADDCFNKNLLLGAFYITDIIYENYKLYIEDMCEHHIIGCYSVFDPIYKVIIQKRYILGLPGNITLSDSELSEKIQKHESRGLHLYSSRNIKINYIEDNIYINK